MTVLSCLLLGVLRMAGQGFVVADAGDRRALPGASVFDKNGTVVCVCDANGRSKIIGGADYPLTGRYLGYHEKAVEAACDTVL